MHGFPATAWNRKIHPSSIYKWPSPSNKCLCDHVSDCSGRPSPPCPCSTGAGIAPKKGHAAVQHSGDICGWSTLYRVSQRSSVSRNACFSLLAQKKKCRLSNVFIIQQLVWEQVNKEELREWGENGAGRHSSTFPGEDRSLFFNTEIRQEVMQSDQKAAWTTYSFHLK